jgi:hypothetical protein
MAQDNIPQIEKMWDFVHDVNNRNIIFFSYIQNLIFFEMYQYILITFAIIGILIIAFIIYNTNSKDNTVQGLVDNRSLDMFRILNSTKYYHLFLTVIYLVLLNLLL